MAVLIGLSLYLLAAAFWTRRWVYGLLVLNVATLGKVAFGFIFGGERGWAALAPALTTLVICDVAA
jgi:hypothetical protein